MLDRVRVMLAPADNFAAACERGGSFGGEVRTARADTVYLAWCDHW